MQLQHNLRCQLAAPVGVPDTLLTPSGKVYTCTFTSSSAKDSSGIIIIILPPATDPGGITVSLRSVWPLPSAEGLGDIDVS